MDIGSIFLILALFLLVGLFVSRPFFERARAGVSASPKEHEISHLMAERDRIIYALHELDFDYTLGKIPQEDYPTQRAMLLQAGADTLKQLDALQASGPSAAGGAVQANGSGEVEARIEAAIAARRADLARQTTTQQEASPAPAGVAIVDADDPLEQALAERRRKRPEKAAGFCPQCGGPLNKSDRFCPKCGKKLA